MYVQCVNLNPQRDNYIFLRKIKHREKSRCMKQKKFKTHEGNFTEEISHNIIIIITHLMCYPSLAERPCTSNKNA